MSQDQQFDQIGMVITGKEEYIAAVKSGLDHSKLVDLESFFKLYHDDEKESRGEFSSVKRTPKLEFFAEVFKNLDEFPTNLQKPKPKVTAARDRLNATISKSSPSLSDLSTPSSISQQKDSSSSSLNITKYDDITTPSETYKQFVKFQKQLKQLYQEIEKQDAEIEYAAKLKQLNTFSHQLEKLLPSQATENLALVPEDEKILQDLVDKMDDLNFIRTNQDVFRDSAVPHSPRRLDNMADIITHCLNAANPF